MVAMLVSANIATSASATASVTYGSAGAACPGGTSSAGTSSVVACVPATETLTAGTLHFNSVAPVVFPATQLTGLEQINLASNTMDVTDATGSGDGWTVSLAATLFSDGVDSLPYGASAITATDLATCDTGSSCTVADNTVTQMPVTVPAGTTMPVAEPIYSANTGSGMGAMSTGLDESLYIPSDVGAGSYSATWMYTLSQSPPTIGSSGQAEPPGLPSAPGPVQGLMATPGDHEITLNWAPSTDPNISSYGVDLDGTQVGTVYAPDPGYTIDDVPNGIPAIVSVDQTDLYGQTSALVTATVTPEDAVTMSSGGSSHSPATVTVAANDGYATVSWSAVAGATGYVVCRTPAVAGSSAPACASNQGQGFQVYTGGALDASDTGLLDGTTYHYTVDAQGPWGNALSSPVPAIPEPAPPAPAGVGQTMVSGTPALAWSPVSVPPAAAPVSYRLYLGSTLNHSDILQTYYPVAGLAAGNYTVRAVNGNGQLSGPSATVTVVPPSTTTTTSTTVPTTTSTTTAATTTTSTTTAATTTTTTAPAVPVVLSESGSTISQYGMSGDLLNTSTLAGIANGVITSQDSTGNHALVYADSGTSNAQAVVVDGNGHKVASASVSSSMAYPVFGQDGVVYNFSTDGLEVYSGASLTLQRVIPNTGSELDGYGNGLGGTTVIPANGDPGVTPANGDELAQYNTASGPETGSQQVIAPYLENAFGTGTTQSFWRNAQPVFGQDGNIYMLAWPGEMSSRIPNTDLVAISPTTGLEVNAWQLPAGGSIPLPPGAQMYAAGKYIAIPDMTWANGSVTSQVILFNTTTRTFTDVLVPTLNSYGFASHLQYAAAVSPDGNYLAVENNFGDVAVIDLSTMDVASTWTMAGAPTPNPYADNSITPNIAILGGPSGGTTTTTTAPTTTTTVPLTAWTNTNSSCDVNYTLSSTVGYYWTLATCTGPSEPAGTQLGYSSTQGYEDSVGSGHDSANYGQVSTGDGFAGGATNADEATYGGPATVTADNDTTGTLHYLQLWTFPSMSGYGLAGTWALPTTTAPGAMTFYLTADGSDDSGASNGEALVSSWNGQPATGAIAMVSSNGSTTAYNVDTDQSLWTVPGVAADDDTGGAVSPDGSEILTVGTGATASDGVNIWNINTGTTGDYTNPGSSPTPAVPGPLPTSDFVVWGPQANDGNAIDNTIVVTNTAGSGGDVTSYDEIGIANWEASTNTPPIFPPTVDSNSNVWIPDSNNLDIINNEGTETKVPVLPNGSADHLSSPVAFDGDYAYVAYSSNTGHTTGLYKVALSAPYTVTAVANVPADFDGAAVTQSQGLLWTAGTNGELYSYSPETGGWAPYTTNNGQDPYPVPSSPYVWLQESSPLALFDMSTDQ